MTTVDKNKVSYGRTNQLQPSVILERIRQGDEYNAAETRQAKQLVAKKYDMAPQDSHQRSKIAAMFGAASRFNPHYVSRTPWKILDALSVKSVPEDLRNMLADLIFHAVKAAALGAEPSAASVTPDTQLVDAIMLSPELFREEIEILHAHMQSEMAAGGLPPAQVDLLDRDIPDLRAVIFGSRQAEDRAVAQATAFLREANAPIVPDEIAIEMPLPEQRAFAAQLPSATAEMKAVLEALLEQSLNGKIAALQAEINALKWAREAEDERKASWHRRLIHMIEDIANVTESAELLAESSRSASDSIVTMIEDLKK